MFAMKPDQLSSSDVWRNISQSVSRSADSCAAGGGGGLHSASATQRPQGARQQRKTSKKLTIYVLGGGLKILCIGNGRFWCIMQHISCHANLNLSKTSRDLYAAGIVYGGGKQRVTHSNTADNKN